MQVICRGMLRLTLIVVPASNFTVTDLFMSFWLLSGDKGLDRRHEDDDVAYLGRSHRAYTSPLLHPQDASRKSW